MKFTQKIIHNQTHQCIYPSGIFDHVHFLIKRRADVQSSQDPSPQGLKAQYSSQISAAKASVNRTSFPYFCCHSTNLPSSTNTCCFWLSSSPRAFSRSRAYRRAEDGPRCWLNAQWKMTIFLSFRVRTSSGIRTSSVEVGTQVDECMWPPTWSNWVISRFDIFKRMFIFMYLSLGRR